MRLSSTINRSSGERIGFLLLAAFFATLVWSLHSSASKSVSFKQGANRLNYSESLPAPTESPTPCCNDKPHLLIGTYYSAKNGLTAKLLLNNKGPDSLTASPSLFSMSGQRFDAPPVTVDGLSYKFIDISTWINSAGLQFQEGSIQVFHYGKDLVLGAQVYLVDENHSLSFDEKLVETKGFKSTQLEGLWWLPSQKGQVLLALSNNSGTAVTATVDALGNTPQRGGQQNFTLAAHETRLLDLQSDVINHANGAMSRYGGISITYSGSPGTLYARGMAQDLASGYSLPIQFSDPAAAKSSRLQGVGLRLGLAGGEALSPVAVVRNVGTTNTTVTGRVSYTDPVGAVNTIPILSLQLSPSELVDLDLGELLRQHSHNQLDAIGGLELEYSTPKGSVIASALSVSSGGNQVFRVPMWDPSAQRSATGGYPWLVDGNSSTMVYIKNVEQQPQHYYLQLSYATGIYSLGIRELQAGETVSYDFRKLRDLQVPDVHGRLLPTDLSIAQVHWSKAGLETGMLLGRSEQVDTMLGISSNYACVNCCPDNEVHARLVPDSASAVVSSSRQFTAQYQLTTCYGQYSDWLEQYDAEWSTNNEDVASVSAGLAQANAAGTATIKADWYADHYVFTDDAPPDPGGIGGIGGQNSCEPAILRDHLSATATFFVQVPSSLSVVSITTIPSSPVYNWSQCYAGNDFGIQIAIQYQVLDQNGEAISSSSMEPQETITNYVVQGSSQSDPRPNFGDLGPTNYPGTSQFTDTHGRFLDAPYGGCLNGSMTASFRQTIRILANQNAYSVRTNNISISSSSDGSGTISNGADIDRSRP